MPAVASPERRVLTILHQRDATPGRLGRLLRARGFSLDYRWPAFGDALPETLSGYAGAIIFGGSASVNGNHAWLRREIDWIAVPLEERVPFIGICLGAQMLARHLGQSVKPHPKGCVEIGYYPVRPTEHGSRLCECPFPGHVYQWHREGFELPQGAALLASGQDFETQAFCYGDRAFGFQFHLEVTFSTVCRWAFLTRERLTEPGACPRLRHVEGWFRHDAAVARWSGAFMRRWLYGTGTPHGEVTRG